MEQPGFALLLKAPGSPHGAWSRHRQLRPICPPAGGRGDAHHGNLQADPLDLDPISGVVTVEPGCPMRDLDQ